jgi:broad specificity phosphatase PhoE
MQPPAAPTRLILLRHAEVEEKFHHLFGGRIDMNLSPLGHQQAASLANYLRGHPFDALYASPMKRVQQTLAPLLATTPLQPTLLDGLREMDFGDWTGMKWSDIATRHNANTSQWLELLASGAVNGAENEKTFRARVENSLQQILRDSAGQTVIVASHGGVVRMLLAIGLGLTLGQFGNFAVDYASVSILEFRPDRTVLQSLNHVPWRS